MSLRQIRDAYKVPTWRGVKVIFGAENGKWVEGTVIGSAGLMLRVRTTPQHGNKKITQHPTHNIRYPEFEHEVPSDFMAFAYSGKVVHRWKPAEAFRYDGRYTTLCGRTLPIGNLGTTDMPRCKKCEVVNDRAKRLEKEMKERENV